VMNDVIGGDTGFVMLLPVPEILGPEDVHVVDPANIERLRGYSNPREVRYECEDFQPYYSNPCENGRDYDTAGSSDGGGGDWGDTGGLGVDVEAEFIVGEYEIVILSAEDSTGLLTWLDREGYGVTPDTGAMLQEYIAAGSYFFAAKVVEGAVGPTDQLSPLQFRYSAEVWSLPIRIGTASSQGIQDLFIYAITPFYDGSTSISNYPELTVEDECMRQEGAELSFGDFWGQTFTDTYEAQSSGAWIKEYAFGNGHCDPCEGEPPDEQTLANLGFTAEDAGYDFMFTRLHMRYTPAQATQDLTLYPTGIVDPEQIRYIEYQQELESYLPVCGIGMVTDNPGECEFDPDPYANADCDGDGIPDAMEGAPEEEEEKSGCSCTTTNRMGVALGPLLGLGLLLLRRRETKG
jgi:MYXO-CTERM domain-containing protein